MIHDRTRACSVIWWGVRVIEYRPTISFRQLYLIVTSYCVGIAAIVASVRNHESLVGAVGLVIMFATTAAFVGRLFHMSFFVIVLLSVILIMTAYLAGLSWFIWQFGIR